MPFPELPPLSHRTRQRLAGWICVLGYAWTLAAPLAHAGRVLPLEGTGRYSQRDVLGRIITTAYDALNRPLTITDNNGTVSTTADDQVTHYGYDLAGRAVRLEEKSAGQTVNWTVNAHDLLGRLKTRTLHSGAAARCVKKN